MGKLLNEKSTITPEIYEWFSGKGINAETVEDFGISLGSDGELVFPYRDGNKRRYGVPSGTRSFRWEKGVDPCLFNLRDSLKRNVFLVEGETDTMKLRQELGDLPDTGVIGLPGIETWEDSMAEDLKNAETIYVILDNDLDYQVAGRVDHAWSQIRLSLGRRAKRIYLPRGVNDVCEFFEDYSLDALRTLVERQPQAGESRFKVLDLTIDPPPIRWVIENMICHGDIHMLIGEPSIGKSWLTMGLAIAVAGGQDTFLGRTVCEHGRVLYVDEENPEDLIYHRLHKLGLNDEIAKNIRYLSNESIRLDRQADELVSEALDYEPELIILDSLTRFHTEDENNAGAMAALFNDALKPLARQTGAAVVLIHHANKTDSNSSYKRSRGSGDITAGADCGYDVRAVAERTIAVSNYKSRRAAQQDTFFVTIQDVEDRVELVGGDQQYIPF
jgi:AAA domain-containing protein